MDAADPRDPENARPEPPDEGQPPPPRPDETAEQPPVDETEPAPGQPVDPWNRQAETVVGGVEPVPPTEPPAGPADGSGTAVMPTVPADEGEQPRWSARAQVPPSGPPRGAMRDEEWGESPERPPRPVLPILIAVVAVVLLVIIGLGLWLALHNSNTPTTPTTTAPPATTAPPTTAPPTTPPPTTPPPTTTAPVGVAVPPLADLDPAAAQAQLNGLGITLVNQQTQPSDTVPSGRVIGTTPPAGTVVLPGQQVTLIISSGPAPTTPPATPS